MSLPFPHILDPSVTPAACDTTMPDIVSGENLKNHVIIGVIADSDSPLLGA